MHRLTGGSTNYYRKRIRMALAEGGQVTTPVTSTWDRAESRRREIRIAPYRDDPARSRYEKFAEKTYVFTLSDEIPGKVVELRSEVLGPAGRLGSGARDSSLPRPCASPANGDARRTSARAGDLPCECAIALLLGFCVASARIRERLSDARPGRVRADLHEGEQGAAAGVDVQMLLRDRRDRRQGRATARGSTFRPSPTASRLRESAEASCAT